MLNSIIAAIAILIAFGGGFFLGAMIVASGAQRVWTDAMLADHPPQWFRQAMVEARKRKMLERQDVDNSDEVDKG